MATVPNQTYSQDRLLISQGAGYSIGQRWLQCSGAAETDWDHRRVLEGLTKTMEGAWADHHWTAARSCLRDIGEHVGMWRRDANITTIDMEPRRLELAESVSPAVIEWLQSQVMMVEGDDGSDSAQRSAD